jgi:hypothetical protein
MDIAKIARHRRRREKGIKGDTAQLAAQLAPLEEVDRRSAAQQVGPLNREVQPGDAAFGAIVVDNEGLDIPRDMMEGGGEKTILGVEPVVLVILIFMMAFIGFIAWQISEMPAK